MKMKEIIARKLMFFLKIFPVKNNKIVVSNFNGKGYGGNPKYVINELLKAHKGLDIVWIVSEDYGDGEFPAGIRTVKQYSISYFFELVTAKIWIDNVRKPAFMVKRKEQFYLQTWHGGVALKKIEGDVEEALTKQYIADAKEDSKNIDLILSNNHDLTSIIRRAFWYDGEILEAGLPRNDIFFQDKKEIVRKVKKVLGIKEQVKMVLYAPTFRKEKKMNMLLNLQVLNDLKKKFGGEWICLLRMHPNVSGVADMIKDNNDMINTSHYSDVQELLVAADILITDYSSTMFDFSVMKKPVFLYAYDIEDYKNDRNFYYEFDELPYPMAETIEELSTEIASFDYDIYQERVEKFFKRIGLVENGDSSAKVIEILEKII